MALYIRDPEANRLARQLAALTGENVSDAVLVAIRERLARETGRRRAPSLRDEIARMQERVARLPVLDQRSDADLIGYDTHGLPRPPA
jgi:antitoxin VapB